VPTAEFNKLLWSGMMGRKPYPTLNGQLGIEKDD
jgi:hypothetical protein